MKTMIINEVPFEVTKPTKNKPVLDNAMRYDARGLYDYYKKPSHIKELTWAMWRNWAADVEGIITFGVSGGNSNIFTITGVYIDELGQSWVLYITPGHNRAILAE